jgi:hypothetical protein
MSILFDMQSTNMLNLVYEFPGRAFIEFWSEDDLIFGSDQTEPHYRMEASSFNYW